MKVVEDVEKIDERSVFEGIYVQEKLVAWCAVCDVLHFCVCEKVRKGPQGTFLWSWYFLFCIRTCENRDRVAFQKGFCQSQHFFILFSSLHFCLLLLQRVCHWKIWWCCWGTKTLADIHTYSNANTNTHPLTHRSVHQARITVWLSSETLNELQGENGSGKKHFSSSPYWNLTPRLQWHIPTCQATAGWIYKEKQSRVRWTVIFKELVMRRDCFWLDRHFDLGQKQ